MKGDNIISKPTWGFVRLRGRKWYIYMRFTGGRRISRVTQARTKTEAKHILNSCLDKNIDHLVRGEITLKKYYEKWIERREVDLKPSTLESYESYYRNHILPFLSDKK